MKNRQTVRLCVEELEGRVVPSTVPVPVTSSNWSGYALVSSNSGSVTDVKGTWNVPSVVASSGTSYSSTWIGIDGFNSNTVEQIGTDSDVSNGVPTYYAWVEMYPQYPVNLSLPIHPGDSISAEVSYGSYLYGRNHYNFELTITNQSLKTNNEVIVLANLSSAKRSSAEWIEEAPSSNKGVLPLSDFNSVSFSGAQATINGSPGGFANNFGSNVTVYSIDMYSGSVHETATGSFSLTTPGSNLSGPSSFTITYVGPAPATSSTLKTNSKHNGPFDALAAQTLAVASVTDLSIAQMVVGSASSTSNSAAVLNSTVSSMPGSVQGVANATALQPQNLASFFAGSANLSVPGTQGSDGPGAYADNWNQSPGVRWFAPMTPAEQQPATPPSDSKDGAENPADMSRLDVSPESSAAIESLAGAMADPGPIFGADIPADQSAAAFALLAVAFYSRPFLVKTDKESRNRRPELNG